jgi:hypothetical protein
LTATDVSKEMGVRLASGKSLGIAINDFDRDGWPDIYVANDQVPSFLLHNGQGKSFEEIGLRSATGLNENGSAFAGMGVDFADYDNDGWQDIFVTALSLEGYILFRNSRDGTFEDISEKTGVKRASLYLITLQKGSCRTREESRARTSRRRHDTEQHGGNCTGYRESMTLPSHITNARSAFSKNSSETNIRRLPSR